MENSDILVTLTQDTGRRQTKQNKNATLNRKLKE
jgi:hypothetical protein